MGKIVSQWQSISKCIPLEENQVHVWSSSLEHAAEIAHEYERLLSEQELIKVGNFISASIRDRYVVVHGFLRNLLAGYLDLNPIDVEFTYGPHGKPYVENHDTSVSLSFSLSHSDEMALFAFSCGRRVGVDLERVRNLADLDLILTKTFSSVEIGRLRSLSPADKTKAFYRGWTIKEAYLKAIGDGISRDLRDLEVSVGAEGHACLTDAAKGNSAGDTWRFEHLMPADEYVGALAVEGVGWQLILLDFPSQQRSEIADESS